MINRNIIDKGTRQKGFTLVELSIVIVIIGFLIAGIAAGTNLIKQAELRSIIADFQSYAVSYNNFFYKYQKIPGDMEVAFTYWGTGCADTATNCNGNNNGVIDFTTGTGEIHKAWKHLEQAGMINAGVVQITAGNITSTVVGSNAPTSKIAAAGYIMYGGTAAAPPFNTFNNIVWVGKARAGTSLTNSAMTTEDIFSIDQKADDGIVNAGGNFVGATTGSIRARDGANAVALDCVSDTTNGYYNLTNKNESCVAGMALN